MIDFQQQQKIEQSLTLSARQIQSLQLLYVPIFELEQSINTEIENNPLLEYEEFSGDALNEPLSNEKVSTSTRNVEDDEENTFDKENNSSYLDNFFEKNSNDTKKPEANAKRDNFFEGITDEESLRQQLLNELSYLNLTIEEFSIAEAIIDNIEDSGILGTTLADIAMIYNCDLEEIERILSIIQSISAPGIGARDLAECLKLQLIAQNQTDPQLFDLVDNYLEEIGNNNLSYIAKSMQISLDRLNCLIEKIRTLNPHPGTKKNTEKNNYIIPEAEIIYDNNLKKFRLIVNDSYLPKIQISERYSNLLNDKFLPPEDRDYLRQKLSDAKNFQTSLILREKTIERIANLIMDNQHEFWFNGIDSLKPMTMAQAAEILEIHEATVSRACAGKYLLTPQGLFEFKFFFAHGIKSNSGEEISNLAIKEKIKFYIDTENSDKPLSDEKIVALLKDDGINISRRTVAKYRDTMNIAPAHKRKSVF